MKKPLCVLMVEDSEDDALLEIRALKRGGYDPVYERVEDAGAMRKAFREKTWDVILCDYQMPKFNGLAAISLLKETGIDIPLIIVSGAIGEETAADCMRYGAHDYIMKGNLSRLVPAIERELQAAESRRQRKRYENEIKELGLSNQRILNAAGDGLYGLNSEGQITFINPAAAEMLGYDNQELIGKGSHDTIHHTRPDGSPFKGEDCPIYKSFKDGIAHNQESDIFIRKDGTTMPVEYTSSPIVENGKVIGGVVSFRDITERKKAAEALNKSLNFQQQLIDALPLPIFYKDLEARYMGCNRAFEQFFGEKREEIAGKSVYDIQPKEIADIYHEKDLSLLQSQEIQIYDSLVLDTGGVVHDVIFHKATFPEIDGSVGGLIGAILDITEQKKAEKALRESEQRFMDVLYSSPDAVLLIDGEQFVDCNEATARMLGYADRNEFLMTHPSKLSPPTQPDGRSSFEKANEMMRIASEVGFHQFEWEHRRASGEDFPVEVSLTSIVHHGKNVIHCMWRELTERKRTEQQLQNTLESLRKAVGTTIQVVASAVETRDPYTSGHQTRSANIARAIAIEMGLTTEKIEGIRLAGSIHDIGKLSIPAEILSKPTKLSAIELLLIREHARQGYEILKDVESPWPLAEIVHQHHERMDGSGYPRNLKGDEILIEARILCVADVVEAMASHRPYRPGLGIDAALDEIEKNSGIFYDSGVADACLSLFREKGFQLEGA